MSYRLRLFAGLSVAATVLVSGVASPAATASDAIVQNRDEPGRNHYQQSVSGVCSQYSCSAVFAEVPAGHRLVLQYITCQLTRDGSEQKLAAWTNYTLSGAYTYLSPLILTQTGTTSLGSPNGNVEYAVSQNVLLYFEALSIPAINFRTDAMIDLPSGSCVLSGYYITEGAS